MTPVAKYLITLQLALLPVTPAAFAQEDAPTEVPAFSQQELDQMLAPVALYPDSLLMHILMASTYPLEVVEAARWSRANPGLSGQQAVQAVEDRAWDPSVKSLVAFPQILTTMDEKLEWMQQLGDAFLAQETQVMDTVQGLRQKAYAAGHLESNEHYQVERQGAHIVIEPPRGEIVYVPYYDPWVVYGGWWWPAYPPVYWAPWSGYYAHAGPVGWYWSVGIFVGPRFFFGFSDWHHRHVTLVHVHHRHPNRAQVHKTWHHDPHHRRGIAYRHHAVHKRFVGPRAVHEARRDFRTHERAAPDARRHGSEGRRLRERNVARRFEARQAPPQQQGIGRLGPRVDRPGMRPDRNLTSRHSNLPNSTASLLDARKNTPTGPRREHDRRRWRNDGVAPDMLSRRRANTPPIRVAPNRALPSTAARPNPQPRTQAVGPQGRSAERRSSGRANLTFGGRVPQANGGRTPSASGRTFTRGSSVGRQNFGGFRAR